MITVFSAAGQLSNDDILTVVDVVLLHRVPKSRRINVKDGIHLQMEQKEDEEAWKPSEWHSWQTRLLAVWLWLRLSQSGRHRI